MEGRHAGGAAGLLAISMGMDMRLGPSSLSLQPALHVNSDFSGGRGACGLEGAVAGCKRSHTYLEHPHPFSLNLTRSNTVSSFEEPSN
jgi:hypothetical protein